MQEKVRWQFLFHDSRSRVYLLWAFIVAIGFVATHYFQRRQANAGWAILSILGLGYMFKVMPMRVRQMKRIFASWFIPIFVGMVFSALAFIMPSLASLTGYLGAFWLLVMAVGFAWNGFVDKPALWYYVAAGVNLIAAVLCYYNDTFLLQQYLIAAIASAWSMLNLWILRT